MPRGNIARIELGESEWVGAHRELSRLAALRARCDAEEGRALLRALRSAAHVHAGFGTFAEYVERLLGYRGRLTYEKLRVAEALERLPQISAALESGALHWSAARELTRVAAVETQAAWLEVARGKSLRQIEALVAGANPGETPGGSGAPSNEPGISARQHVLRFEVTGETFAAVREAVAQLRRAQNSRVDDDTALLAMARALLGGPKDDGRSSYQISLSVCPGCGRGTQRAAGERVAVSTEAVEMARCDAQQVVLAQSEFSADGDISRAGALDDIDIGIRADIDIGADSLASPASSDRKPGPTVQSLQRQTPANDGPVVLETGRKAASIIAPIAAGQTSNTHVGTPAPRHHRAHPRTTQSVPPAVRRRVLHRDGHICSVPGCRNALYLDLHHLIPRAEGGPHVDENLVTLCGVHHRAVHSGELLIEGRPHDLRFLHADGTPFGAPLEPRALDANAKVFSALCNLGFREVEARRALNELRRQLDTRSLDTPALLRAALQRLGARRA
jgi:hypothetical protein